MDDCAADPGKSRQGAAPARWPALIELRRQLRRLMVWSGVGQTIAGLLAALMLAGWIDWSFRPESSWGRGMLSATVAGVLIALLWRTLFRPLRVPLTDVMLARQVDRSFPGLEGRLTAAAEFLSRNVDPALGSPELQRCLLKQVDQDLRHVRPEDVLDPSRLRPSLAAAALLCGMAALLLWAFPSEAALTVKRLALPGTVLPWPRETELELQFANGTRISWDPREPIAIVRDSKLMLRVTNRRGPLPQDLKLHTLQPGQESAESRWIAVQPGERGDEATFELIAHADSQSFRITGGDDTVQPWYRLEAVDPPELMESRIEVLPPAYTGQAMEQLTPGATQVRGWLGSRVRIQGRADRPVARAELKVANRAPVVVPLGEDQQSWDAELTIETPGSQQFEFVLRDARGFAVENPPTFELRGEVDAIPDVRIEEPAGELWVTPEASLEMVTTARDDLGLTSLAQSWQIAEQDVSSVPIVVWEDRPRERIHRHVWELAPLALVPGSRVIFWMEARDAFDVGEPHVGRSPLRSLLVVTPQDKTAELSNRLAETAGDLGELMTSEERLADQAQSLATQLRDVGTLTQSDQDLLLRLRAEQRRLASDLTDANAGLRGRVRQLQEEYTANHISSPAAQALLEQLGSDLDQVAEEVLPEIDGHLTQAEKELTQPTVSNEAPTNGASQLTAAEKGQRQLAGILRQRQDELAQWNGVRSIGQQLETLRRGQKDLTEQTRELSEQTLARPLSELTNQQRADLQKLADRQRQLGRQIEELPERLNKLEQQLSSSEPQAADSARELAEALRASELAQEVRQAADDLASNRLGEAGPAQQQIEELLQKWEQDWNQSSEEGDDLEQMAKKTEAAGQRARELQQDVESLQDTLRKQGSSPSDPARKEVEQKLQKLRQQAQELARELQRLSRRMPHDLADQTAEELARAGQELEQNQSTEANESLQRAQDRLGQLQQQLARAKNQAEEQLAREDFQRTAGMLRSLMTRQATVVEESERLDKARQASGRLTRTQLRSLQDLAGVERELQQQAAEIVQLLSRAEIAKVAVEGVRQTLEQVTTRLADRQLDVLTLYLEKDVVRRLDLLLKAWDQSASPADEPADRPAPSEEDQSPQQAGPSGEAFPLQMQLAVLRALQADCLERTIELEQLKTDEGSLPEGMAGVLDDLAREQGSLIGLTERLLQAFRQQQESAANPTEGQGDPTPVREPRSEQPVP